MSWMGGEVISGRWNKIGAGRLPTLSGLWWLVDGWFFRARIRIILFDSWKWDGFIDLIFYNTRLGDERRCFNRGKWRELHGGVGFFEGGYFEAEADIYINIFRGYGTEAIAVDTGAISFVVNASILFIYHIVFSKSI